MCELHETTLPNKPDRTSIHSIAYLYFLCANNRRGRPQFPSLHGFHVVSRKPTTEIPSGRKAINNMQKKIVYIDVVGSQELCSIDVIVHIRPTEYMRSASGELQIVTLCMSNKEKGSIQL